MSENTYDSLTAKGLSEIQDELHAAQLNMNILQETIDTLVIERDEARVQLQRLRERSSLEMAEARVTEARITRAHNAVIKTVNHLEAQCNQLLLEVDWRRAAQSDLISALRRTLDAHDETSEA